MEYTAAEILKFTTPGELFSDQTDTLKKEYLRLAKLWHPDNHANSSEANQVMAKINLLYQQGLELLEQGKWERPGFLRLKAFDGKTYEFNYLTVSNFELGKIYLGSKMICYLLEKTQRNFYQNALQQLESFAFANEKMRLEISKYLPKLLAKFETKDYYGMVISKTAELLCLKDVLAFYHGQLTDRHVAWILGTLYNLACYLDYAGLSHNAISLENYFISPKEHTGALLGGWWYTVKQGSKMLGVSEKLYGIMPPVVKNEKQGSILTDLEAIRLVGRELLGDPNGTRLESMKVAPSSMINWLRGVASETAYQDYQNWDQVLSASFGRKKFVTLDLSERDLYSK